MVILTSFLPGLEGTATLPLFPGKDGILGVWPFLPADDLADFLGLVLPSSESDEDDPDVDV